MIASPGPLPQPRDRYEFRWAYDLTRMIEKFFASLAGDWTAQSTIIGLGGRRRGVTNVDEPTYVIKLTDDVIDVNHGAAVELTLADNPGRGQRFTIQDSSGKASTNNITIVAASGIDLNGSMDNVVLKNDFMRVTVIYNGKQYHLATG